MITKITGKLISLGIDQLTLDVDNWQYQVLIPEFTRRKLQNRVGQQVVLHTIHYLEGNPTQGKLTPRLVGFISEVEREFFEMFCSVDGVGVRKALRAMMRPVADVAETIEQQDASGLAELPGIGPATADRIIAKLRRKMPKFALLVSRDVQPGDGGTARDLLGETFQVLRELGHSEADARRLLDAATTGKRKFKDVESLLRAVYEQNKQPSSENGA